MGELLCKLGGGWDNLSFSKLLKEYWVIGINGEVILSMFVSMGSQAEALYQCILGLSLKLQYKQANATFKWS